MKPSAAVGGLQVPILLVVSRQKWSFCIYSIASLCSGRDRDTRHFDVGVWTPWRLDARTSLVRLIEQFTQQMLTEFWRQMRSSDWFSTFRDKNRCNELASTLADRDNRTIVLWKHYSTNCASRFWCEIQRQKAMLSRFRITLWKNMNTNHSFY
jgi:hypothetical protein